MTASDLKQLAEEYFEDSNALFEGNRFKSAIYLAGYSLECALKFRICQTLGWSDFPRSNAHQALKRHDLNFLLDYSGKLWEVKKEHASDWQKVEKWNPEMRYEANTAVTVSDCTKFILSVRHLVRLLTT